MSTSAFSCIAADALPAARLDLTTTLRNDIGPFAAGPEMSDTSPSLTSIVKKEAALLAVFLFIGLVLLPIAIWFVGKAVFGAYGGAGYADFYGTLSGKIRSGDLVAWFLVLSPWLALQVLRLLAHGWRATSRM